MTELLSLSRDRKVSPFSKYRPDYGVHTATILNSFGLPAGASCPGRTDFCGACYGVNAEKRDNVAKSLRRNLQLLLEAEARGGVEALADLLHRSLRPWRTQSAKLPPEHNIFRIHWDGDFFSVSYAEAWVRVMAQHPDTQFWTYTRSFGHPVDVVPTLVEVENLSLYLSVDSQNMERAMWVRCAYPSINFALCASTHDIARDLVPLERQAVPCPENNRTIPLVGEDGRGACVSCGLCVRGNRDITFASAGAVNVSLRGHPTLELSWLCSGPGCTNQLTGRQRKFCCDKCRWSEYRVRIRETA